MVPPRLVSLSSALTHAHDGSRKFTDMATMPETCRKQAITLLGGPREADESRVEVLEVFLHDLRGVTLGVDRDENGLDRDLRV